jgi:hypothetical protein
MENEYDIAYKERYNEIELDVENFYESYGLTHIAGEPYKIQQKEFKKLEIPGVENPSCKNEYEPCNNILYPDINILGADINDFFIRLYTEGNEKFEQGYYITKKSENGKYDIIIIKDEKSIIKKDYQKIKTMIVEIFYKTEYVQNRFKKTKSARNTLVIN